MSVFYRKTKKRWVVAYPETPNVWKQKVCPPTITNKRQALAWEAEFLAAGKASGAIVAQRARGEEPTVRELAKKWLKLREGDEDLAPATVADNRSALDARILPIFGDRHLSTITTAELRAWVRTMRGEVSSHRCRNVVNTFKVFCEDTLAEDWVKLPANPIEHPGVRKEIPIARNVSKDVIHLSMPQAVALVSCKTLGPMSRVKHALSLTTGLRGGELAGLAIEDADTKSSPPRLTVRRAWRLKGREWGKTKTDAAERVVPLCPLAVAAVELWRDHYWKAWVRRKPEPSDPLFPGEDGEPYRYDHEAEMLRDDLDIAGQPDTLNGHNIDAHATRRTFATWLANAGVPKEDRQRLMGHQAKDVTEKHYTASDMDRLHRAVCTLPLGPELLKDLVPNLVPGRHKG